MVARRSNRDWEGNEAVIALAGIRPTVHALETVGGTTEETYTVADPTTKRVILFYDGEGVTDLHMAINETADATTLPVLPGVYFVVEASQTEVIHLYNTTGSTITVYITEIR
jgi:hypothetical protein